MAVRLNWRILLEMTLVSGAIPGERWVRLPSFPPDRLQGECAHRAISGADHIAAGVAGESRLVPYASFADLLELFLKDEEAPLS